MKKAPLKGMNDYLPQETALRDALQQKILNVYLKNGFSRITTPIVEDAENLDKSEGGENLNLIFKILKRGEKLEKALANQNWDDLADMGLRYDLTLPLARFYAAHLTDLPQPFKVIQIDRVYRAERPQKGRLREFVQCDIDILNDASPTAEIELILTTAEALREIGLGAFTVKINDRSLLLALLALFGFPENQLLSVCMSFDKLDKIGPAGVCEELRQKGISPTCIDRFAQFIEAGDFRLEQVQSYLPDHEALARLKYIQETVCRLNHGAFPVVFDLSLVRGQGYYTGTIFEVVHNNYKGAIAGGGRYDKLIEKFGGAPTPAVGFSIGFERIYGLLKTADDSQRHLVPRLVLLYETDQFEAAWQTARSYQDQYQVTLVKAAKKLGKQLNQYQSKAYQAFMIYGKDDQPRLFE